MINTVQAKGKTVEEAIQNALEELGTTEDKVTVKVLDIPDSGILSMFGNKYAKVEVTVNDDTLENGKAFLTELLEKMGVKGTVDAYYEDDVLMLDIDSRETGILIGRRGQTLDSIQYLTSLVVNRDRSDYIRVSLDVAGYRQKRKNSLQDLADRIALKVEKTKTSYELEPMNPYERRIIHSALQNYEHVTTHSEGEEPNRHIVIDYKR
ncbi:MAG: protein jag [Eubacteriaceae bacterium]|nr:protein jag [Eubacteriaceae bacterium]MBR2780023.1 protein jag [Eubacteriaceae bacterium]MCR4893175.1 protein jag [Eubacteriales bacterium]